MRTRRTIALIILLAVIGCAFALYILYPREPISEGMPLSYWADQYYTSKWVTPNKSLETQAQNAIRHISVQARPALLKMLATRESALRIWVTARVPIVVLKKLNILDKSEYRDRIHEHRRLGAEGLAALGSDAKPAVPALIALLKDENEGVRGLTLYTLGCLGPNARDALPILIAQLDDPEESDSIKIEAILALDRIHIEPELVVPILTKHAEEFRNGNNQFLLQITLGAMSRFGLHARQSVPVFVEVLTSNDQNMRAFAAQYLGRFGLAAEDAIPVLLKCLDDPELLVRYRAATALGDIGARSDVVIPALIEKLDESHRATNNYQGAIVALGAFRGQSKAALPRILEFLNDQDYNLRAAATNALKQIDPEAAAKAGVK
ncbi:MAG: repeat-containing protein [Pedosphaera sp.]|nr:repeat-containing protein [Pedosphaera sp.]